MKLHWCLALAVVARVAADVAQAAAAAAASTVNFDAKMAEQAKNLHKFMPGPTGPGFKDKGMTKEAEFQQMGRFGIPDLNNPLAQDLTDLNFDTKIAGDKYVGVLFYAPQMAEYEFFALHWEKAAMELGENLKLYTSAEIEMARFDISEPEHQDIAEQYNIGRDKPEMLLFYNGTVLTPIRAGGGHAEIRQFVIAQTLPAVTELSTENEVKRWKRRKVFNNVNLKYLAFMDPAAGDDARAEFTAVANELKVRMQFGVVTSQALLTAAIGSAGSPDSNIYLIRDFDSPRVIAFPSLPFTAAHAMNLVHEYDMPLLTCLGDSDESRVRSFLQHPKPYRLLAFFKNEAAKEAASPHLEAVGRAFGSQVLVGYTVEDPEDAMNFDYQFWDVPNDKPAILIVHMRRDRKYLYAGDDAHTPEQLQAFVGNVLDGKVQPKLKSQEPPTPNNGLVRVLVTKSFAREVYEVPGRDTLVLLTRHDRHGPSNWFAHHVDKFAKVWRREKRLLIARMDMAQNDLLELNDTDWNSLPRLLYIPAGAKPGDLGTAVSQLYPTMEDLLQFVQTHQSTELTVDDKVWARVHAEDLELLRQHREAKAADEDIEHPADILKELEAEIQAMRPPKDEL
ncbi:hypothetical protein ACHHYP_00969 [Achlya hypogyna]|uniref:Thioredoxin domain-containing protein n=1 Tax=Achlya hypogyna TaxID=1202772 RepID=A0A1V9Z9J5_ACHHY|nr:hypothetical protein ACHHYP_00969 [Achlya hypogyna]